MDNRMNYYDIRMKDICMAMDAHEIQEKKVICLIASTNVVSPAVRKLMDTDMINRVAEGKDGDSLLPGADLFYTIDKMGRAEVEKIFRAEFADLRPISGSQANHIVYQALTKPGDTIIIPSIRSGAHVSMSGKVSREMRGLRFIYTKNLAESLLIDQMDLLDKINKYHPAMLFLGGSVITEWQNLQQSVDAIHALGGIVVFDASQVAGLIATDSFPNPLDYGVDVMTMTTCKTLPGSSHAWIMGKRCYQKQIEDTIFPGYVSGGHLQEHVGAIYALYEICKYGSAYGKTIIRNSRILGQELEEGGFKFIRTKDGELTNTQQLIAYGHKSVDIRTIEDRLLNIHILLNKNLLPEEGFVKYGIRIGAQEITRQGVTEEQIHQIGDLINRYLTEKKPNLEWYREQVAQIKQAFRGYQFV